MNPRIAILICTHDRPEFLRLLLDGLRHERQPGVFLCVVDNGMRSSAAIVEPFRAEFELFYRRVEEPGVVVARNACLALAMDHAPDVLVFIDDDETPNSGWLAAMMRTLRDTNADFVTGPVEAKFLVPPPDWAIRGDFFRHDGRSYRTSNLAIRAASFPKDPEDWFQARFNRLGGEDSELLGRLVGGGAVHEVAADAVVTEFVPAERLRRRYIWRCGTRDGAIIAETILTARGNTAAAYAACLIEAAKKLGYAANHLFWTLRSPWRVNSAIRDVNASAGIVLKLAGRSSHYYGSHGAAAQDQPT
ncbi:MAG: glycosyltransferase [Hyphomicrobiales bacterium]